MWEFIETPTFSNLVSKYLSDDEYAALQAELNENPAQGVVIPGSGGVRKIRWGGLGHGKRAGLRVIYYFRNAENQIWMLTIYAKNVRENIPAHVLKQIRETIENEKNS